jgi:hypothetical protein
MANKTKKEANTILKLSKAEGINNRKETKKRAEKLLSLLNPFRFVIKFVINSEAIKSTKMIPLETIPLTKEDETETVSTE